MATVFKAAEKAVNKSDEKKVVDKRINKQRVLLLSSRGTVFRYVALVGSAQIVAKAKALLPFMPN